VNFDLRKRTVLLKDTLKFLKESSGRILRAKRLRAGLTQKQAAKAAGVRPETVSRIEAGRGNPTIGTLLRLTRVVEKSS
jgi:transcriptional regulator with XRE-family HTH domain